MEELAAEIKQKLKAALSHYECQPMTRKTKENLVQDVACLLEGYGLEGVQFSVKTDEHNPHKLLIEPYSVIDKLIFRGILTE